MIADNTAGTLGGGIGSYNVADVITVTNSAVVGNSANTSGGGVYGYDDAEIALTNGE